MFEENIKILVWVSFIMPIVMALLLIWFFVSYQRRKLQNEEEKHKHELREKEMLLEQQNMIQSERNRIAAEMHDDLGSGLTKIKYLSDGLYANVADEKSQNDIRKIADYSNVLVKDMGEIIWALNSRFDNLQGLVGYLRRYAAEFLEDCGFEHQINANLDFKDVIVGGEKRRNIFLVTKELLHNAVKYSEAEKIILTITSNDKLRVHIAEVGGKGFDPELLIEKGNGIYNIKRRMEVIGGQLSFEKTPFSMNSYIIAPLD